MLRSRVHFLIGPMVTLVTVAAILATDHYLVRVPNPGAISFAAVVFATYLGGFLSGSISAVIALLYAVYYFSIPGAPFRLAPDNFVRIGVLAVGLPALVLMVGVLQRRAWRAAQCEREARTEVERTNSELRSLQAALEHIGDGIVLLDRELRAQFINRAFRDLWHLPEEKASEKPAFVGLMYHGRKTRAYAVPDGDLDAYVSQRVAAVRLGDETPTDIRLASSDVVRFKCKALPDGGRMLSYVYVTDLVRHNDELETFRAAFDQVDYGVVLLDRDLRTEFMNRSVLELGQLSAPAPGEKPFFSHLLRQVGENGAYAVPKEFLDGYVAERIAWVRRGDASPIDLNLTDGRIVRVKCIRLHDDARMLTYIDVTDGVKHERELEGLASTDALTGLHNRRAFLALANNEWERFQRYGRPLSMLMVDADHFKSINDNFGHDVGDKVLAQLASHCSDARRGSDIVARLGGEEFAILLPETDLASAALVAEKLRSSIGAQTVEVDGTNIAITVSIGVAVAKRSISDLDDLIKRADMALYAAKRGGRNRVALDQPSRSKQEPWPVASQVA
jgi:diguanylate cyclase (GGDEF)-like protein